MCVISLDKQIHIYSFDTSAFYTDEEHMLEIKINELCNTKNKQKAERDILTEYHYGTLTKEKAEVKYRALYKVKRDELVVIGDKDRIRQIDKEIKNTNSVIKILKDELVSLLHSHRSVRTLRSEYLVSRNIISVFESITA